MGLEICTNNRSMKCINQSKVTDNRVQEMITYKDHPKRHLITCFLPLADKAEGVAAPTSPKDDSELVAHRRQYDPTEYPAMKLTLPLEYDPLTATAVSMLQLAPLDKTFDHTYTHRAARFCYSNGVDFATFWNWCKQKDDTPERLHKWMKHWENLGRFNGVSQSSFCFTLSRFYPDILKERSLMRFKDLCNITIDKRISKLDLNKYKQKFVYCNLPMGFGKTGACIKAVSKSK